MAAAACSGPTSQQSTSTTTTTTTPPPPTTGGAEGSLGAVLSRGSLRVGVAGSTPLTDFDLRLAESMAAELDPGLFVQPVSVTPADRFDLLSSGQIDLIMGGVTRTVARDGLYGRTTNYLMDGIAVLVPQDSAIGDRPGLASLTIAVAEGTSLGPVLAGSLESQGISAVVLETPEPFTALQDGDADAITTSVIDGLVGRPGLRPIIISADTGVAIVTRADDIDLTEALDDALRRIIADGRWEDLFVESFGLRPQWSIAEMAAAGPLG